MQMVTVDVSVVLQGIGLCYASSRRLNNAARTLLDASSRRLDNAVRGLLENHGDSGIVFGLWSLAVEELGKAVLLNDQVRNRHPGEFVSLQPGFDHESQFRKGLDQLVSIRDITLGRALRVAVGSPEPTTVSDPRVSSATISLGSWMTGLFVDTSPEARVLPTVDLRFSLLYVQWDRVAQRWTDARGSHTPSHGSMEWHIINVLDERLHPA
jgi:hypothetical protein